MNSLNMWILGQVIALFVALVVWKEYGTAVALPVAYALAILVDIRKGK